MLDLALSLPIAGAGAIALALVFARQAERTRCDGGPYAYSRQAFGDLTGFLMAWAYWLSFLLGVPVVAIAFVGYLGVFVPVLNDNAVYQGLTALGLITIFTLINIRGLKEMSAAQITLTFSDGQTTVTPGSTLAGDLSQHIFQRDGVVQQLIVSFS